MEPYQEAHPTASLLLRAECRRGHPAGSRRGGGGARLVATLGPRGILVPVERVVRAVASDGRLNREIPVCHFEKADPSPAGTSRLVDRESAQLFFTGFRYGNRRQEEP